MSMSNHIAVIGAGLCGICAVKSLKEEGFEPVCFERTGHLGGLWRYHEDDTDGLASVMKTTIINSSKELSAASNFPPPAKFPNYMPHNLYLEYVTMIAKEFDVLRHIKYYHEVISVVPSNDYMATGRWVVSVKDKQNGTTTSGIFDGVMVCTGHHCYPNIPMFPGKETFQGNILHTHSLKGNKGFEDQRVAIIGLGSSGLDASADICLVAKQVYLSTRRGAWILPRVGPYGQPFDTTILSRSNYLLRKFLPDSVVSIYMERILNQRFSHALYNLKPKHRIWNQHPTVSDVLPANLISGKVVIKGNVRTFVQNGVIFDGEQNFTEVDTVIFATGYRIKFPFLSDDIIQIQENRVKLYKLMYPPNLLHPTLAFIGLIQPFGALLPLAEMQCRLATMLLRGKCKLPTPEKMRKDIEKTERDNQRKFIDSQRHTIEVEYIDYFDKLAHLIGAKPNLCTMAITDPRLFWACLMKPCLPYQYRLQGPHRWDGARNAILTYREREVAPFGHAMKTKAKNEEVFREINY